MVKFQKQAESPVCTNDRTHELNVSLIALHLSTCSSYKVLKPTCSEQYSTLIDMKNFCYPNLTATVPRGCVNREDEDGGKWWVMVCSTGWGRGKDGSVKPVCMVVSESFSSKVLSKLATYNVTSVLFICSTCERFTMETYKVNSRKMFFSCHHNKHNAITCSWESHTRDCN